MLTLEEGMVFFILFMPQGNGFIGQKVPDPCQQISTWSASVPLLVGAIAAALGFVPGCACA